MVACAPEKLANDRFYEAWSGPIWMVNATKYGHLGVNDAGVSKVGGVLCADSDEPKVSIEVAEKTGTPIPMAWDRSGHRVSGPAISMGAKYFDSNGDPKLVDDGLKAMTQMLYDWHQAGTMSKDLWGSVSGSKYHAPNDWWNAAEVVFMMSGSWQIGRFANEVGDDFDWWAVPAPCGPAACTGMPGGNALLAFNANPAVGKVMDYLSSKEQLSSFIGQVLAIPGHLDLQVDYQTDDPNAKHALNTFAGAVPTIDQVAVDLQAHVDNRIMFNAIISRLGQAIVGEMTMEEAWTRMDEDVEKQLKEKYGG
jgi:alpha-1,4-digalacturonate transport system substrate-binding protein